MARARNIKPGLLKNELLGVADPLLTILFASLWMLADREGRLEDRPLRIKAETFPYRENLDVNGYLTVLQQLGFIHRYKINEIPFIQVIEFKKHQTPHKTEKASVIPEYTPESLIPCGICEKKEIEQVVNGGLTEPLPPDSLIPDSLIPDSLIPDSLIPDSGIRNKSTVENKKKEHEEIFEYWQLKLNHPSAKLDSKRLRAIKARLLDGYTVGEICKAIDGCFVDPFSQGKNDRNTVYDDIELICRTAVKLDSFIKIAERGVNLNSGMSENRRKTLENMNLFLEKHS